MNKQQNTSHGAQPKRTIPVPKIVKPAQPAATGEGEQHPKVGPLKPANVLKAVHKEREKHAAWLTTAKIATKVVPRIP